MGTERSFPSGSCPGFAFELERSALGVPNPEALTFCDLTGAGKVELWVNGKSAGAVKVPGTLSDISLEQGINHLLCHWTGGAAQMGIRFRNIMRRLETEFGFP
jgi:hypothetical protein